MIPGANLLSIALTMIASQTMTYLAYVSRSTNSIGLQVPVYAAPVTVKGSIQPIGRALMETLGLDMQRRYVNIFVPQGVVDIARDVSSDKFQFGGYTYQAISITQWVTVDSWNQVLAVEVPS
jgi:hypothetical protein